MQNQMTKWFLKKLQNTIINLPSYIFRVRTLILLGYFLFILFLDFLQLYEWGRVNIVSMFRFLETGIREQKRYQKRIQASVDNIIQYVNDLHYEIKIENCMKDKNNPFIKQTIAFLF